MSKQLIKARLSDIMKINKCRCSKNIKQEKAMEKRFIVFLIFGYMVTSSHITFAETIYLKSGEKVSGKIVAQSAKSVMIQGEGGAYHSYPTDEVMQIKKAGSDEEQKINTSSMSVDPSEGRFKTIVSNIGKALTAAASPTGKEYTGQQDKAFFTNLGESLNELRSFVRENPESIWADDAQYIIATLSAGNPKQEALELEYLLKNYPNMHIEDWTKENLNDVIPNGPIGLTVRLQLCMDYKQLADAEKLKNICAESIKEYPDKEKIFRKLSEGATASK
jgi:hypothetical protein